MPADRDPDESDGLFSYPFFFDDDPPDPIHLPSSTPGILFSLGDSGTVPTAETAADIHDRFQRVGVLAYLSGEGSNPENNPQVSAELAKHSPGDKSYQAVLAGYTHGYRGAQMSC